MKRQSAIGVFVLLLALWLGATTHAQALREGIVSQVSNLRAGPGTTFEIVGTAQAGQKVIIVGQSPTGNWYEIEGGRWIYASLVTIDPQASATLASYGVKGVCNAAAQNIARGVDESDPEWIAVGLQELDRCANEAKILMASLNRPTATPAPPTATSVPVRVEQSTVILPTATPIPPTVAPAQNCDPSYPDFCLAPGIPDLDCKDIPHRRFRVFQPDPHRFDGDKDGIGCE